MTRDKKSFQVTASRNYKSDSHYFHSFSLSHLKILLFFPFLFPCLFSFSFPHPPNKTHTHPPLGAVTATPGRLSSPGARFSLFHTFTENRHEKLYGKTLHTASEEGSVSLATASPTAHARRRATHKSWPATGTASISCVLALGMQCDGRCRLLVR